MFNGGNLRNIPPANECDSKSNPETVDALSVHSFSGILSFQVSGEAANEIDSTSTASSEKAGEEEAETTGELKEL